MASCFTSDHRASTVPPLDCAHKLQEYAGRPCRKRSEGKTTWPGRKQVYRFYQNGGYLDHDIITTADDQPFGHPLLQPIMKEGRRLAASPPLADVRRHRAEQLGQLPQSLRTLDSAPAYDVQISEPLQSLAQTVDRVSTTQGVM